MKQRVNSPKLSLEPERGFREKGEIPAVSFLNNGAMDKVQKIKIGVLLALAVVSLVLLVLWLTDVIGFGLVAIFIIVQTAASVGVRVWAENAVHKPE